MVLPPEHINQSDDSIGVKVIQTREKGFCIR